MFSWQDFNAAGIQLTYGSRICREPGLPPAEGLSSDDQHGPTCLMHGRDAPLI